MSPDFLALVAREWLMTPLVIALAVLPGLGFAGVAARRIRLSWPETVAMSFAFTVAMTSAVATLAYLTHLHLNVVIGAYLAFIPVSLVFFVREWRNGHLKHPDLEPAGLLIGGAASLIAMLERPWFRSGADTFYHVAATRSLLVTGRPLVTDPFLGTDPPVLDPTSGVWHTIQAVFSRTLATDISTLYLGITALGAGMIMLCFWILVRRVGGSARAATIASAAMAVVAYHVDFRVMAYPKHVSEALVFLGIALLVRLLDEPVWPVVGVAAVVGMATATMHLAAAEFLFLAGGFLVLGLVFALVMERLVARERWWDRQLLMVLAALALVAVLSVPVLLPKVGALSGSSVMGAESYLDLRDHVMHVGNFDVVKFGGMFTGGPLVFFPMLVLLGFAAPAAFRDRDPHALAAFALVAMIPVVLNDPFFTPFALRFSSYMTARMAALMRFLPFVLVAWVLGRPLRGREQLMGRLAGVCIALAVVGAGPDLVATVSGWQPPMFQRGLDVFGLGATWAYDVRASWGPKELERMRTLFGNTYPVVAAEPHTGYYFCGLEPVAVVAPKLSHAPAFIEGKDGPKRRLDMERFFDRWASESERREIARRYGVRYAVVWRSRTGPEVEQGMLKQSSLFKMAVSSPTLDLLEVTP
jgi:hypothetical protein